MLDERLRGILNSQNISIAEFADMCELPIETIKNIYYGKTTDPKISTVMKIAKALDYSVNCLMGECAHDKEEMQLLGFYRMCGNHGKSLIQLTAKYEALTAKDERDSYGKHKIPYLLAKGNLNEGIEYDNCEVSEIDTTVADAFVGIKLTTNDLVPKYCKGDILLLANRFPHNKEYAVFYKGGKGYLRQYIEQDNKYILRSVHNTKEDKTFRRMDQVEYIGTCIGVIMA